MQAAVPALESARLLASFDWMATVVKAFAAVLKMVRNWTSHDATACSRMTESDVAFLFLIALRICFKLVTNGVERFETALLKLIGKAGSFDESALKRCYEISFADIRKRYDNLPANDSKVIRFFDAMVNELQRSGHLAREEQMKCLRQILWHQLYYAENGGFSPRLERFNKTAFLSELTQRLYAISF